MKRSIETKKEISLNRKLGYLFINPKKKSLNSNNQLWVASDVNGHKATNLTGRDTLLNVLPNQSPLSSVRWSPLSDLQTDANYFQSSNDQKRAVILMGHSCVTWSNFKGNRASYRWGWPIETRWNWDFQRNFSRETRQENFGARTREMFGYTGVSNKGGEVDLESGETLYPGLSYGENQLRWGFIRKVYGILAAQIVLTTIVSSVTVLYSPINDLLRGNSGLLLFLCFLPLICKLVIDSFPNRCRKVLVYLFVNRIRFVFKLTGWIHFVISLDRNLGCRLRNYGHRCCCCLLRSTSLFLVEGQFDDGMLLFVDFRIL